MFITSGCPLFRRKSPRTAHPIHKVRCTLFAAHSRRQISEIMSKKKRIIRADTPEGQMAGEAIVEAVKNQIYDNNPPEAALTLTRLLKNGESRENAMRLIACALSVELFAVLKNNETFNEVRYVDNLRRLPELPFEESDEI